jgi:hypothetical protein
MKTKLGLPETTTMIVTCFQQDHILERVWGNRRRFAESASAAGYDLVTTPNFSLWLGHTRLEHRYNIRRSILVFEALAEAGAPTIPHVAWLLNKDVDDWIEALCRWQGTKMFSIDLTTISLCGWDEGLLGLVRLFSAIGSGWEVLVNGVEREDRINQLNAICGHIHLTDLPPENCTSCKLTVLRIVQGGQRAEKQVHRGTDRRSAQRA